MKYPLAYLTTFITYGTWLHGDKRASVDDEHNRFGAQFVPHNDRGLFAGQEDRYGGSAAGEACYGKRAAI
jgi:hypothetical protein